MNAIDIIIIGIIVACTLISAAWGLVRQVIAVGGLILGLVLAGQFSPQVAQALGFISDPTVARGVAFVIIVGLVGLTASIIASVLYFGVGLLFLGWLDALLGAGLGFIQGWLAAGVTLVAAVVFLPAWSTEQLQQSILVSKVFGVASSVALLFAPPDLKSSIQAVAAQLK